MKLRFERGALTDLDEIFAYSATRHPKFRRFPVGGYLIVCEVGSNEVIVHYVRDGARRRPWESE